MTDIITDSEIEAGILPQNRRFFQVTAGPIPRSMIGLIEAFWKAITAISPAVRFTRSVHVIFGTAPFSLALGSGELRYTPKDDVLNVCIEHIIFLDCNKMIGLHPDIQVACILEELAHGLMSISDEHLVSVVVATLYPVITWSDGKYSLTEVAS